MLNTLVNLLADDSPPIQNGSTLLMVVAVIMLPAIGISLFGIQKERDGGSPWLKFAGIVPALLASGLSWRNFQFASDPFSREANELSGRTTFIYMASFIVPLVFIALLIVWHFIGGKFKRTTPKDY